MAIGVSNFQILTPQQANPGMSQLRQAILAQNQRLANRRAIATLPYAAPQAQSDLLKTQLGNQLTQATLPYAAPMAAANLDELQQNNRLIGPKAAALLALQQQQAAEAGQETLADKIKNQYLAQSEQADINQKKAMADYYTSGGRGAAGIQIQSNAQNLINSLNPNLKTPEQQRQAFDAYVNGDEVLPDGTLLAPLDVKARGGINMWAMKQAPASMISQQIKANQGESELKVLSQMAQKDNAPYATTYKGYSPKQIMDTFKNDDESQERLGNFIAAQQIQYDIAQNQIRIQAGEPGFHTTEGLMKASEQNINKLYPKLSDKARSAAAKRMQLYTEKALDARNAYGINPSKIFSEQAKAQKSQNDSNEEIVTYDGNGKLRISNG
jgi:hypothetical protein